MDCSRILMPPAVECDVGEGDGCMNMTGHAENAQLAQLSRLCQLSGYHPLEQLSKQFHGHGTHSWDVEAEVPRRTLKSTDCLEATALVGRGKASKNQLDLGPSVKLRRWDRVDMQAFCPLL
jgi:hypothetical protein